MLDKMKEKKPIIVGVLAVILAVGAIGYEVWGIADEQAGEDTTTAEGGDIDAAAEDGAVDTEGQSLEELWAAYGDGENDLAATLTATLWKEASQKGNRYLTFNETTAQTTSGTTTTSREYALSDVSSEAMDTDEGTVTRTTATVTDADGNQAELTLDTAESGAVLTCPIFDEGSWTAAGDAGSCQISSVPEAIDSLIDGKGDSMRGMVATYITESIPTATVAQCSSDASVSSSDNRVYVPWSITAAKNTTVFGIYDMSTGEISVEGSEEQ